MVEKPTIVRQTYCFDIDGTICSTTGLNYSDAIPFVDRIEKINKLFADGNIIKLFTARGSETGIDWNKTTTMQLAVWGVNYHELIFGKPSADFYIDDKGINDKDFKWETKNFDNGNL